MFRVVQFLVSKITNSLQPVGAQWLSVRVLDTRLRGERSGSVVECLTRDRGAAGSSLTGVTVFCP